MADDRSARARSAIIPALAEALAVEGVLLRPEQGLRIVGRLVDELTAAGVLAERWVGVTDQGWSDRVCAACSRPVRVWERTGRRVILDPDPSDVGDTLIAQDGTPVGVIREDVAGRFVLYRSHFFTCPNHLVEVTDG